MRAFRLCKDRYATDLSGRGAERAGGRWNSKGVPMVYTGTSRALCVVEMAVHLPLGILPEGYAMVEIALPDYAVRSVDLTALPPDWNAIPAGRATQVLGDAFAKQQHSLVLKVPSAVVSGDHNLLINPLHPDHRKIEIASVSPFSFDHRLFAE